MTATRLSSGLRRVVKFSWERRRTNAKNLGFPGGWGAMVKNRNFRRRRLSDIAKMGPDWGAPRDQIRPFRGRAVVLTMEISPGGLALTGFPGDAVINEFV